MLSKVFASWLLVLAPAPFTAPFASCQVVGVRRSVDGGAPAGVRSTPIVAVRPVRRGETREAPAAPRRRVWATHQAVPAALSAAGGRAARPLCRLAESAPPVPGALEHHAARCARVLTGRRTLGTILRV